MKPVEDMPEKDLRDLIHSLHDYPLTGHHARTKLQNKKHTYILTADNRCNRITSLSLPKKKKKRIKWSCVVLLLGGSMGIAQTTAAPFSILIHDCFIQVVRLSPKTPNSQYLPERHIPSVSTQDGYSHVTTRDVLLILWWLLPSQLLSMDKHLKKSISCIRTARKL